MDGGRSGRAARSYATRREARLARNNVWGPQSQKLSPRPSEDLWRPQGHPCNHTSLMLPIASKSHPEALQSALKMATPHRNPFAELEAAISQQNGIPANRGRKGMRDARPSRRASARKGPQALAKASQEPHGVSAVTDFGEQAGDRSKRNRDEARPGAQPPSIPGAATRPARTETASSLFLRNKGRLGTHAPGAP